MRAGLFTNGIRFLPPLVITDDQLHEGLGVVEQALAEVEARVLVGGRGPSLTASSGRGARRHGRDDLSQRPRVDGARRAPGRDRARVSGRPHRGRRRRPRRAGASRARHADRRSRRADPDPGLHRRPRAHLEDRASADHADRRAWRVEPRPSGRAPARAGQRTAARRLAAGARLQRGAVRRWPAAHPCRSRRGHRRSARRPDADVRPHRRLQQRGAAAGRGHAEHRVASGRRDRSRRRTASRPACCAKPPWGWCCDRSRRHRGTSTRP